MEPIRPFDVGELTKFIGQYIRNDCFSELQDLHMALADRRDGGLHNQDVKDLAPWLNQALDYAKSGVKVDLVEDVVGNPQFQVSPKPDFLKPLGRWELYDSKGEYVPSEHLLGRIYRKFKDVEYAIPERVDNGNLERKVSVSLGRGSKEQDALLSARAPSKTPRGVPRPHQRSIRFLPQLFEASEHSLDLGDR